MGKKKEFNNYEICGNITKIFIQKRNKEEFITLINTKHLQRLIDLNKYWCLEWNNFTKSYYARTAFYLGKKDGKVKTKNIKLHNFVLDKDMSILIDHINRNTLDNRDENLRESSISENAKNRKSKNSNNKSGYRNVSFIYKHYRVQLQINGKHHMFPEKFDNPEDANIFAEAMRLKYYGDFAGDG